MKKKIISVLSTFLCIIGMSAQVPGSFQYQAVLRNDDGSIASNKPLEVRVRIHQGAADGTVVYEEDHTTSSADNVHVKSPDGKLWKIKVSNDGTVSAEAVTE